MTDLLISSFNAEWMNDWFVSDGNIPSFKEKFKDRETGNFIRTTDVASKVAGLIKSLKSDILSIQEGPSTKGEMLLFINDYLNNSYKCEISKDGSSQKLFILYKDGLFDQVKKVNTTYDPWEFDKDGDYKLDTVNFTRTPLEMDFTINQKTLKIVTVHLKSLFVNKGQELWTNIETRNFYIAASLQNRKRILTEAIKLREYVDSTLSQSPNMIILGDMNDGPGREYFEKYLLGMDITSELLGNIYFPKNIFSTTLDPDNDYSVIFDDFVSNMPERKILLDRILISPSLIDIVNESLVNHDTFDSVTTDINKRDGRPSDHRPVSLSIDFS